MPIESRARCDENQTWTLREASEVTGCLSVDRSSRQTGCTSRLQRQREFNSDRGGNLRDRTGSLPAGNRLLGAAVARTIPGSTRLSHPLGEHVFAPEAPFPTGRLV